MATKSPAPSPKRRCFVLAYTRPDAVITAAGAGWGKAPKRACWLDADGNTVEFLCDADKLEGAKGFRVYLGHRWYAAINPHILEQLKAAGDHEFLNPPVVEQKPKPAPAAPKAKGAKP